MRYVADKHLLDVIASEFSCIYLSDLKYMKGASRARISRFIDERISAQDASLNEWNDALGIYEFLHRAIIS